MTINELVDLLAAYIAAGRGNEPAVAMLYDPNFPAAVLDALDTSNWVVTEVDDLEVGGGALLGARREQS